MCTCSLTQSTDAQAGLKIQELLLTQRDYSQPEIIKHLFKY